MVLYWGWVRWAWLQGGTQKYKGHLQGQGEHSLQSPRNSLPPKAGLIEAMHFDLFVKCVQHPHGLFGPLGHLARPANPPCSGKSLLL